jgi:hypothetical protein
MRERWPRIHAATFVSLLASLLYATPCIAQAGLGHLEDASVAPKGLLRLRAITAWTRYDEQFTPSGVAPLGGFLTADSLGAKQLPALAPIQSLVQSAAGSPFTLTLGRSRLDATARQEVIPVGLEYGVTSRLSVSVVAPIVRKRVAALVRLDTTGTPNVGPNPQRTSTLASQTNLQVQSEFSNAISQLQNRIQSCQANPAGPGCAALNGRQAEAQQLIQSSQSFASDVATLYGGSSSTGMAFVPIAQSAAQQAVALRVADFNTKYRDLLSTTANLLQDVPAAAFGPAGSAEFQNYFVGELGRDSLNVQERVEIGDVELGFKALLLDRPRTPQRHSALQFAVASSLRLPTGGRQSYSAIANLSSGDGSYILDSRAFLDARAGRFGVLAVGQFATSLRDRDTLQTPTRNSRWTELQVAPRWYLSEPLSLHAAYSLRSTDKTGGDQLLGGGLTFSTLSAYRAGGRGLPIEARFTHLEAVSGDANRPKFFRDQIEMRIYFRLH